jgi:hypothetical protein
MREAHAAEQRRLSEQRAMDAAEAAARAGQDQLDRIAKYKWTNAPRGTAPRRLKRIAGNGHRRRPRGSKNRCEYATCPGRARPPTTSRKHNRPSLLGHRKCRRSPGRTRSKDLCSSCAPGTVMPFASNSPWREWMHAFRSCFYDDSEPVSTTGVATTGVATADGTTGMALGIQTCFQLCITPT